ncbi:Carbon-nitrogen hydrolase [Coniosporium tulheliwenetii]|uniref:Carbon-nitrogen hydrolase n=1 Tax=Coniosporium tulheliwenetii TaxID=3383036 RepID=A0ACC2ZKS7_9PEZI|nr:Carbon-nitrogen hydrolase [Cladosporium sp. JES 115]
MARIEVDVEQAVGQICSTADLAHNLSQCQTLVQKAAEAGAQALFLPEASDYIATSAASSLSLVQPATTSPFVQGLQSSARQHSLPIHVGLHEPGASGKVQNTLIWISETGEITHRYQKLHLFDVSIAGGPMLQESASVEKGPMLLPPFSTPVGNVGALICFDLRFPEPSLALRRQGAQILTYPSAFTVPTGRAHWEPLLRARAIETQSYVVAAAQCGRHNEKRVSYGHTGGVDEDGMVEGKGAGGVEGASEPLVAMAEIDLGYLEKVRREMPLLRRTDVYPEV